MKKTNAKMTSAPQTLCYRCEHRARFLEKGHGPRCECKETTKSVHSCYMYQPVTPVALQANENDSRPMLSGWLLSARAHGVELPKSYMWRAVVVVDEKEKTYIRYVEPQLVALTAKKRERRTKKKR